MSNKPLPTGDEALALELGHLYVSAPMRLETPRRTGHGMPPLRVLIGGVSIDNKGWLYAWVAYVPTAADVPTLMVWPRAQGSVPFSSVVSATSEIEVVGRVDTPARAVARLSHHLSSVARARIDPDVEYLDRAAAAYRAELRRRRDQAAAWGGTTRAA
ncbi:MAG TPA: hypothetical protein VFW14_17995 [Gaiellales bacterium]|jgi:hypothetical protein|nr:hypothetical protein [Gaiellales bacterium]